MTLLTKSGITICAIVCLCIVQAQVYAQGTRLLRQPTLSATQIAFEYGGDIWVVPVVMPAASPAHQR